MSKEPKPTTRLSPMEIGLLKQKLIKIAKRRGITLQQAVKEALEAYAKADNGGKAA